MTKLAENKKIPVSTVSRMMGMRKSETFQETPVERSNNSEASGE